MTKTCPIMSFRKPEWEEIFCLGEECAFWDEEKEQCCLKTQALAAPVNPVVSFPSVSTSPAIIPNSSGDWVNHNPYRIDCQEEDIDYSQVVISGMCGALKDEFKL